MVQDYMGNRPQQLLLLLLLSSLTLYGPDQATASEGCDPTSYSVPKSPAQRARSAPAVIEGTVQQICSFDEVLVLPTPADCKPLKWPKNTSVPYSALVNVRTVFKGASSDFQGQVLVSGFGPASRCMNDVEPGKAYIFFLSTLQGRLIAAYYDGKFSAVIPAKPANREAVSGSAWHSASARKLLQTGSAQAGQAAPSAVCLLPTVVGPCRAAVLQYYYNSTTASCGTFIYGGCQGNGNRFPSLQECQVICGLAGSAEALGAAPAPAPVPAQAPTGTTLIGLREAGG